MKNIINILMALVGISVMELEGGYLLCFCPEEEDATAPDACFLKQVGDDVLVFKDSPHRKETLYESIINGNLLEPDDILSIEELRLLDEDQILEKIIGG